MPKINYLLILLINTFSGLLFAHHEEYSARVENDDTRIGLSVQDGRFFEMEAGTGWTTVYDNVQTKGVVTLGVNHESSIYVGQAYDLMYKMDIKWYDENGDDFLIQDVCLRVAYDPSAAVNYTDKSSYVVEGAHKMEVMVTEVYDYSSSTPCAGSVTSFSPQNLFMEGVISVERYFLSFDPTANWTVQPGHRLLNTDLDTQDDFIELYWGYLEGAEEYEIEWTFINDYEYDDYATASGQLMPNDIDLNLRSFELNCTRVTTTDQTYRIPLLFSRGYVVYRVRGIARGGLPDLSNNPTYGDWVQGKWSTTGNMLGSTGKLADFPTYLAVQEHDPLKNWQHIATYAEEGKRKDVVSYYDGSMRSRQTVTRINSDDHAAVGQVLYDFQGREAIQILPTPIEEGTLKYRNQFNKDNQQGELTREDFDLDNVNPCEPNILQLSTLDGAGLYYSSNNPYQQSWQQYVPEANGYAYVQTEYMPDNTGRIRRQSGVGETHTLESGHESKYFYGTPAQEELDRLFGANVGYDKYYRKNLVLDANGQTSVSYQDAHGRVIATSLAGEKPGNLHALKDESDIDQTTSGAEQFAVDLLGKVNATDPDTPADKNNRTSDDAMLWYSGELLASSSGTSEFNYSVTIPPFVDSCLSVDLPVVVDLELGLLGSCAEELFTYGTTNQLVETLGTFSLTGGGTLSESWNATDGLEAFLQTGSYTAYKYLRVNQDALDAYAEAYLDLATEGCVVDYNEFLNYQDSLLNSLIDCDVTCEECVESLNETFINNPDYGAIPEPGDPAYEAYKAAYDDCMLPCTGKTFCETMLDILLHDVSPNGQYGGYNGSNFSANSYPLSVFNTSNSLPSGLHFQSPSLNYFDADGQPSLVFIDDINGGQYVTPNNLTLEQFIANWSPSWAMTLLPLHPEYCAYEYCEDLNEANYTVGSGQISSEEFDKLLLETWTYSDAQNATINGASVNLTNLLSGSSILYDPFFNSTEGAPYVSAMTLKMNNYANGMSMTQFAAYTADCGTIYGGTCTGTYTGNDNAWNNYKSFYTSEKQKFIEKARQEYTIDNGCYSGCIGAFDMSFVFVPGFWNPFIFSNWPVTSGFFDFISPIDLCSFSNYAKYKNKVRRFDPGTSNLTGNDAVDVANIGAQADYEYYVQTGQCPNATDVQFFLNALAQDNALLVSGNPISNYAAFTVELYEILKNADSYTTDYVAYQIQPQISGTTLQIGFEANGVASNCAFSLTLPSGGTYSWGTYGSTWSIENIWNLTATGPGTFTVDVQLDDANVLVLEGSSGCVVIDNCAQDFQTWLDDQCQPNVFATEITNLMSTLAAAGELNNTNVNVSTAPFDVLITQLTSALGGGTWTWGGSSGVYTLTNGTSTLDITIQNISFAPDFVLEILPQSQSVVPGNPNGTITWIDGSSQIITDPITILLDNQPLMLGDCGVIETLSCPDDKQKRREALETLVQKVLEGEIQQGDLLNTYAFFSNYLQPELGTSAYTVLTDLNTASGGIVIMDIYSQDTVCEITLTLEQNWLNISLADITAIEGLYAQDGMAQLGPNGQTYDFVLHAKYNNYLVFASGTSCFTISNCLNCYECGLTVYNADLLKREYGTYTNLMNQLGLGNLIVSFEVFAQSSADRECIKMFFGYLSTLSTPVDATTFVNIDQFCGRAVCGITYDHYVQHVTEDPASPYYLTAEEFLTYSDLCMSSYAQYYLATASPMTVDMFCSEITPIPECEPYHFGPVDLPEPDDHDPCQMYLDDLIAYNTDLNYTNYINSLLEDFKAAYKRHIMETAVEQFNRDYLNNEYQYTLYYYDQAGNLVQTVPPKGVDILPFTSLAAVSQDRANGTHTTLPNHTYKTQYTYNTLNQLVEQTTPDTDGPSEFYYDALGRLVVSQNPKQAVYTQPAYSYTLYDNIGRVQEVGEIADVATISQTITGATGDFEPGHPFYDWLITSASSSGLPVRREVTRTKYDAGLADPAIDAAFAGTQGELRNRIAAVTYEELYDWDEQTFDFASHYSYDVHGNVKTLVQDNTLLAPMGRRFTRMDYSYELISGNVNQVAYQDYFQDAFYHRYVYDADNRIVQAWTSQNKIHWDRDAKYFYYDHGPLARTEIGHNKVQGTDYAYTIHGWIKGVNSNTLRAQRDQGRDGLVAPNLNRYVAQDEFGYTLGYFEGDYVSIGAHTTGDRFEADYSANSAFTSRNLYNGNITHMVTGIGQLMQSGAAPQAMVYDYDQLNRIAAAHSFNGMNLSTNIWNSGTLSDDYAASYKYDLNGNLYHLSRNGYAGSGNLAMDELSYTYQPGTNKLLQVTDPVSAVNYANDFDGTSNYTYDELGQLMSDSGEEIASIDWKVNNKIRSITRSTGSTKDELEFMYDAMGQRIAKIVKPRTGGVPSAQSEWKYTFYQRDAQGNTMGIYTFSNGEFKLTEQHLYGSSRLGIINRNLVIDPLIDTMNYVTVENTLGDKQYELSNHLGNVLVTVSDKKVVEPNGSMTEVAYYYADVSSANDYYPFGMQMEGRSYQSSGYRYGYQGSEKDDEVKGNGNSYTTEYRLLDVRIGKWLSVDPLADHPNQIGMSPYSAFWNNPIRYTDPDGRCPDCPDGNYTIQSGDNFWNLENQWGLDHGTLQNLNPGVDPKNLQVGQSIVANTDIPVNSSFSTTSTATTYETQTIQQKQPRSYAGALVFAGTASAVDGPLPIGEIVGGVALLGTAIYYAVTPTPTISIDISVPRTTTTNNPAPFNYVTYTKTNPTTGQVYVGRSSGYGDPASIVARRDANHHMTGYGSAVLSTFAPATLPGGYASRALDPSYWSIRGSEQTQINYYRNLGISGNSYNGISPSNPNLQRYMDAAKKVLKP